jgi:hypothetical protein
VLWGWLDGEKKGSVETHSEVKILKYLGNLGSPETRGVPSLYMGAITMWPQHNSDNNFSKHISIVVMLLLHIFLSTRCRLRILILRSFSPT